MSMQAINYALTLPVCEPGPRLLLILIAHHVNWQSGDMFVSQEALADEARMTSRTVRNHLGSLEDNGFIVRTQQRDESGRRGVDKIELVGYLEWQHVIYHGGTIPDPETRGKGGKKPPEKSSARPTGKDGQPENQPEKNGSPTGSSFPVYKEPFLTLREPSAPLPPSAQPEPEAASGQEIEIDLIGYDRTARRPPIITDADRQWAIEQKPADWDERAPELAWEDHVAEQAEAFEAKHADDRKPHAEWQGLWRRVWWPKADPSIRHPKTAPARPHPFVTSKDPAWERVLEALTADERKVAERFGVAQFRPEDPRAGLIGGAHA